MFFNSSNSRENGNLNKFSSFASLNFNLSRKKLSDLLTWEPKHHLKQPLLNLHPSLITHALYANKLIVDYMDTDTIGKETANGGEVSNLDIERVSSLVNLGCQVSNKEIRDEIYCQLIKQTTGNIDRTSCLRGYQLILSCLAGFSPSQELTPFLSSHLHVGSFGGALLSRRIVRLAESCLRALRMVNILGSRSWGLTKSEIIAIISENSGISMKVWFSKNQGIDIIVDSWMTTKELTVAACDKLGIDCSPIMTLCLISNSPDEHFEANSASCRGVLNTAFNHLYRHYTKLQPPTSDVIKRKLDSLFGVENGKENLNLSARVGRALDSFLQVHDLCRLEISSGYYLNAAEMCKEKLNAPKRSSIYDLRQCLSSTLHMMLRGKKLPIPLKADNEVVLRLHLVIWIFPHVGFYESPNSEVKANTSDHCKIFQRDYSEVKVYRDKWVEKPIVIFDEFPTSLCDECEVSECEATMRNRICWPSNMAARNVLFTQLTDVIADKRQEPVEDIDILRMVALIFAEQHQASPGCQSGILSVTKMKEIVKSSFESVLPIKLKNMIPSNRDDAKNAIQSRFIFLVNHVIRSEFPDVCVSESEVEIKEFDVTDFAFQSRASRKLKRSLHRNALKISRSLKPTEICDLSDNFLWSDFLCTIIVKLWLLLVNLTAQECREQYLSFARYLIGYGAVKFYPSAVRIGILTLQEEIDSTGQMDAANGGSDDNYHVTYDNSKIPRWTTLETVYCCNTSTGQVWNSHNQTQVTTTIQVEINFQGVLVMEHSVTRTIMSEQTNLQKCRESTNDMKSKKVLFKISLDEILSWGYNDNTIILKFKQRGSGHEASYYSDDDDNEESQTGCEERQNQNVRIDRIDEEQKQDWTECHLWNACSSEAASSGSLVSTASGCPLHPRCCDLYSEDVRVRKFGSQDSVESDENTLMNKVWGKPHDSHCLEVKNEVDDGQPAEHEGSSESLDGSSLHAHTSGIQSVPHRDADSRNTSFVTAASSDVNTANNQRCLDGQPGPMQKATTQPKVYGSSTESIAIDMLYGAELAEILKLYNIQRITASGIEED